VAVFLEATGRGCWRNSRLHWLVGTQAFDHKDLDFFQPIALVEASGVCSGRRNMETDFIGSAVTGNQARSSPPVPRPRWSVLTMRVLT
jgi:hypothetical protein